MSNHKNNGVTSRRTELATWLKTWLPTALAIILVVVGSVASWVKLDSLHNRYKVGDPHPVYKDLHQQYIEPILKIYDECGNAKKPEDKNYCDNLVAEFGYSISAQDLAAQEAMAGATEGILDATIYLLGIGLLTLVLLFVTVGSSIWVLHEARKTTHQAGLATRASLGTAKEAGNTTAAARDSVAVAERAEMAYLRVSYELTLEHPGLKDSGWRIITPVITNYGKSPAFDVEAVFDLDLNAWHGEQTISEGFDPSERGRYNIAPNKAIRFTGSKFALGGLIGEDPSVHFVASEVSYKTVFDEERIGPKYESTQILVNSRKQRSAMRRRAEYGPPPRVAEMTIVEMKDIDEIIFRNVTYADFLAAHDEVVARMREQPRSSMRGAKPETDDEPEQN